MLETAINRHEKRIKIDTVNETSKPQSSKSKKDKSIRNESKKDMALDKSRSLDKSRFSQITETEDTVKNLNNQGLFHHPVYLIKVPKYNNQKK